MSTKKVGRIESPMQLDDTTFAAGLDVAAKQVQHVVRAGRPPGAKNRQVDKADGQLTRCRCGSTRRTEYFNRRVLDIAGINPLTGEEYTQIVIRRTSCRDCGQLRDDRHFVFEPVKRQRKK